MLFCKLLRPNTDIIVSFSWRSQLPLCATLSASAFLFPIQGVVINDEDYESLVLMKLRQAAERQKRTQKEEGSASSCTFPCFASVQPKDPSSSSQVPIQPENPFLRSSPCLIKHTCLMSHKSSHARCLQHK